MKAKEIPLEVLRQAKTTKNGEIIPFTFRYNLNNSNVFSIMKKSFDNFRSSKTMSSFF